VRLHFDNYSNIILYTINLLYYLFVALILSVR